MIAEGLPASGTYLCDTRRIPDGAGYRIRVEATDNGEGGVPDSGGMPLTGADETDGRFLVDNTPPTANLGIVEGDYLALDQLALAATVGDLPFFPPEGVVRPHARPLHITLTLDPGDPGERALEPGDTLGLAAVTPGRHRVRLHVRDQSGLVANDVRVIHVLTAAEGFALVQARLQALHADPTCVPGALPALAEAHALLAAALQRQRSGNVQGCVQKLAEAAGQLQLAGAAEPRAGALAATLAVLVRDLLQPRVEYLETTIGVADPQVTPIRGFFTAGVALLAGGNFSGAILEFKKAQNRINALDTQSPEIVRLAPSARSLQTGEFTVRYAFADFLTDIAPTSVLFEVDGVVRTAEATHSDQRLRIEFAGATALPEGDHEFRLTVVDVQGNPATRVDRIWVDLAAPTATWTSPAAGWVTSNRPLARLAYADAAPGSGIDPAEGVQILLDGADVTAESLRGEEFATHQTPIGSELTEGTHVYAATIQDRAGRSVTAVRTFAVDTIAPTMSVLSPAAGGMVGAPPLIELSFADTHGATLIAARLNGSDRLGRFDITPNRAHWQTSAVDLMNGDNQLEVTVVDPAGNSSSLETSFHFVADPGPGDDSQLLVLQIVAGDRQEGVIGRSVEGPQIPGTASTQPCTPLQVRAVDARHGNAPVAGVPLQFTGPGLVVDAPTFSTITNAEGIAAVRYILSRTPGEQHVTVSVLGDDSVTPVTFTEIAVVPTLTVLYPARLGSEVLLGSGESFVYTELTRPGSGRPIRVEATTRVEALDGTGRPILQPPGLFINPRCRAINDYGEASFDVIPEVVGSWTLRTSVLEFTDVEVPPHTISITSAERAARPAAPSIPTVVKPRQGSITTHDHEMRFNVDLADMVLFPGAVGLERFDVFLTGPKDELGRDMYEFSPVLENPAARAWAPAFAASSALFSVFGVIVRPTSDTVGVRPMPVDLLVIHFMVSPGGWTGVGQRNEKVAVGAPEVRMVYENDGESVEAVPNQRLSDFAAAATLVKLRAEIRAPKDQDKASFGGTLRSLDRCRIVSSDTAGFPSAIQDITLPRVDDTNPRFDAYSSDPILVTPDVSATTPTGLPSGIIYQRIAAGLEFMEEGDIFGLEDRKDVAIKIASMSPDIPVPQDVGYGGAFDVMVNGRINLAQDEQARIEFDVSPVDRGTRLLSLTQSPDPIVRAWSLDGSLDLGPTISRKSVNLPTTAPLSTGLMLRAGRLDSAEADRYRESSVHIEYSYKGTSASSKEQTAKPIDIPIRVGGPRKKVRLVIWHNVSKDENGVPFAPIEPDFKTRILPHTQDVWDQACIMLLHDPENPLDFHRFDNQNTQEVKEGNEQSFENLLTNLPPVPEEMSVEDRLEENTLTVFVIHSVLDVNSTSIPGIAFHDRHFAVVKSKTQVGEIGVLAHELGHLLGNLRDLDSLQDTTTRENLMANKGAAPRRGHRLMQDIVNPTTGKGQVEASRTTLPDGYFK